jgi:isopentenyl phosphate kinase
MGVMTVVKLGGSFISDKGRPFSVRRRSLYNAINSLSGSGVVFVHGGGSFGHYVASKYSLSSRDVDSSGKGVWETRDAMVRLNRIICRYMSRAGFKPYVIPGVALLDLDLSPRRGIDLVLETILDSGLTPVTYGDVLPVKDGFRIVSGDYLSMVLCKVLHPNRMVFIIDKPGILRDPEKNSTLLETVDSDELSNYEASSPKDATGGLAYKLKMAKLISEMGVETAFVSGFNTDALIKSVFGRPFKGTLVVSKR